MNIAFPVLKELSSSLILKLNVVLFSSILSCSIKFSKIGWSFKTSIFIVLFTFATVSSLKIIFVAINSQIPLLLLASTSIWYCPSATTKGI